ncbi:MAG: hypothetical protein ACHQQQ_13630 [Bacteroidota bacterium]
MDTYRRQFSWFGAALIVFGGALLLHRLNVINIGFMSIVYGFLILAGLAGVIRGFSDNLRGKVFWSSVLFLAGVFFLLRSIDRFNIAYYLMVPAMFLIFGISFFMMFLNNVREWHLLIPMVFLCGIGMAFLLSEMGYVYWDYWDVWYIVHTYWPIGIIFLGLGLMLRRRHHIHPPTQPTV